MLCVQSQYIFFDGIGSSDVDQNTLNLDLDPEFWPKLDPEPELCFKF